MDKINLVFAFMAAGDFLDTEAIALVHSLRDFGGGLAKNPVWILVPESGKPFSRDHQDRLIRAGVKLISFPMDETLASFPFGGKVLAAAEAEAQARREARLLVWLDPDTIVVKEPGDFLLPSDKVAGYRPVHHKLIGSLFDAPPDVFWELNYRFCGVPEERIFPMVTVADQKKIRPCFNAGCLVVRPEKGLLQAWRENFSRFYRHPDFEACYVRDRLYRIFIHQTLLAATLLHQCETEELTELSWRINYPLHLHHEHLPKNRPNTLNELITFRYEGSFRKPGWQHTLPATGDLKAWLMRQFSFS